MLLVKGQYSFDLPFNEALQLLEKVELIGDALVCMNHVELYADHSYRFAMHLNVPKLGGFYRGELQLKELERVDDESIKSCKYQIDVTGDRFGSPMTASGVMTLAATDESKTVLNYEVETDAFESYDRHVQMIAKPVAPRIINRGLEEVEDYLKQQSADSQVQLTARYA